MGTLTRAVLWLIGLRLLAILGYFLIFERFAPLDFIHPLLQSNFLFWSWANFDGEHYLSIAKFGYQLRNGFPQYAFFPLLPLLIRLAAYLVQDYLLAGLVISFASLVAVLWLLPRWFTLVSRGSARFLELALLLSPGAVFLGAVYTEPLYLALTLAVFILAEHKRFLPAALLAGLVTATRVNGLLVAGFLVLMLFRSSVPRLKALGYGLLSLSGLLSYMVFLWFKTGDALAWYHAQAAWGKATATSPVTTALSYAQALTTQFQPDLVHLVVLFEVAVTLWAIYLVVQVFRHRLLSFPYLFYLAGNLALPLATGSLGSMPRFFLLLFPAQLALLRLRPLPRLIVYTVSCLIMITGVILFTRGHWFA